MSDDQLFLQYLAMQLAPPRVIRDRSNAFEEYDDRTFQERFRMTKVSTLILLGKVELQLQHASDRNHALPPMYQLLIALRFFATGSFQIVVSDLAGVHKSTACRAVHRVARAIANLRSKYVQFPQSDEERTQTMREFYAIAQFPGVLGTIDCTHIPIMSPGGDNAELYRNRKGYFSINVQTIANARLMITDIVARWYGSAHDATIFSNCAIRAQFENGIIPCGHLLADNGYGVKPYMLTPLLSPVSEPEKRYNRCQISTRNTVERQYGVWKRRFPALKLGMRTTVENALVVIIATSVLHNMALGMGENEPPEDKTLKLMLDEQRRSRPAYRVYDDVSDDIIRVPDRPAGTGPRSGQTVRQRIITDYFTW
jgi:nuclease HARBI1